MRHRHSGRQLNRNSSHRKAMFRNMAVSLVEHELIKTTVPKAKELRSYAEPLITLAKKDSVANRRLAFDRTRARKPLASCLMNWVHATLSAPEATSVSSSVAIEPAIKRPWLMSNWLIDPSLKALRMISS